MRDGIDYMQLNVYISTPWRLLIADYGNKAISILFLVYQMIYAEKGYYTDWDQDRALLLSMTTTDLEVEVIQQVIESAVSRGIFDREIYEKHKVLTSKEVQDYYLRIVKRRKSNSPNSLYIISERLSEYISPPQLEFKPASTNCEVDLVVNQEKDHDNEVGSHEVMRLQITDNQEELLVSDDVVMNVAPLGESFNVLPPTLESQMDITKPVEVNSKNIPENVEPRQVFLAYKKYCPNLEKVHIFSKEREDACQELLGSFTLAQICNAFQAMDENTWNRGDNTSNWVANFDYCIQPQKIESYLGRAAFAKSAQKFRESKPPKNPVVNSKPDKKYSDLEE